MESKEKEFDLYEPMRKWLQQYLANKYPRGSVITLDAHSRKLDQVLSDNHMLEDFPQTQGINIEIDVLGIVYDVNRVELAFIEAKKQALTLEHLGQLLIYCKLCDPAEAFLMSSVGLGNLSNVLKILNRQDLLKYGDSKKIKMIHVCKWNKRANTVDYGTMIPKM